jgi:predicted Zn-dependent protease
VKERLATAAVLLGGVAAALGLSLGSSSSGEGQPYVPASDGVVLETLTASAPARPADSLDEATAVTRARELITESRRRSGDPRLLGQAKAVLAKWWNEPTPPAEVRLLRATLKQSMHDFEGSLVDLDALVAERPDDGQAWLTRATVLTVVGRYDDALASCAHLTARPLEQTVCAAGPRALRGELSQALESLQSLAGGGDAATVAWVLSVQGELLRWKGDDAEAAKVLRRSLELAPDDGYTRSLLAELELDAGRDEAVRALYTGRELNDSELLWVVLAKDETRRDELAGRVAANRQRGETLHRREESRYALRVEHDVTRALELAVANWAQQREVADARVLLEAAAAAKSKSAAAPGVAWLDATMLPMPALRALAKELSP